MVVDLKSVALIAVSLLVFVLFIAVLGQGFKVNSNMHGNSGKKSDSSSSATKTETPKSEEK